MEPSLITLPAIHLIGMQIRATPMTPEIPALWQRFMPHLDTVPTVSPNVSYGVMHSMNTQTMEFDYLCGLAVTADTEVPADCIRFTIPTQEYVVFPAQFNALGDTYAFFYDTWLPSSGYVQTGGPYFERYGADFNAQPSDVVDLYFPIRPQ